MEEVSDEIHDVQRSVDDIQRQIGQSFKNLNSRGGSANRNEQNLLNLLRELDKRATVLHGYADSIISIANEISPKNKTTSESQQNKIKAINQSIESYKNQYNMLQQSFNVNVRKKVDVLKEFSNLNQKYLEFTEEENTYEKKLPKSSASINTITDKQEYDQVVENYKHYQTLVSDLDKQINSISNSIATYSSLFPRMQSQKNNFIQCSTSLNDCKSLWEKILNLDKEKASIIMKQNEILNEIKSKENEIRRHKEDGFASTQQFEDSLVCEAQSSPFRFRSKNRQKILMEQIEITEAEIDQTKTILDEVSSDYDKNLGYETALGDKLFSFEEVIRQIDDENESLSNFSMSLTSEIDNNSLLEINHVQKSEDLFESLKDLRARLKEEQRLYYEAHYSDGQNQIVKDLNDMAKESEEVLHERELEIRKKTALKFKIKKEKIDIENLKSAIIRATEHIEKLNGERYKLERDAKIVHSIKNDCRSLSGIQSSNVKRIASLSRTAVIKNEASVEKLSRTVAELEKQFVSKSEKVNELSQRVSIKSTIAESGSQLLTSSDIDRESMKYKAKDRAQTAEKVFSAITKTYGIIRSHLKNSNFGKNNLVDYENQIERVIDKTDDLVTWVQVFGRDNQFHV